MDEFERIAMAMINDLEAQHAARARELGVTAEELHERNAAAEARRKREHARSAWFGRHRGAVPDRVLEDVWHERLANPGPLRVVDAWLATDAPCLVLLGGTGIGKTVAALHGSLRHADGSRFVRATDLGAAVKPTLDERKLGARELSPRHVEYLILDDLGVEQATPRFSEALFAVVDSRQSPSRRTVITSNLSRADFRARYDARVISRLNEMARVVDVPGADMRARRAGL